jgi:ATP-dependent protease HslVU (ClpYQ) ATPase subunit
MVEREAIKNTEENGIVFIDEIDKIIDVHRSGTFSLQVLNIIM